MAAFVDSENEKIAKELLDNFKSVHVKPGPMYQDINRRKALLALPYDELEGIYYLTESHTPGLRFKASLQYDKALHSDESSTPKTIKKESMELPCENSDLKNKIDVMLNHLEEMPKEWTIVQLTPQFNQQESLEYDPDQAYTNPIHISVFNCGEKDKQPFCVTVNAPFDKIANRTIEIYREMKEIVKDNKLLIGNVQVTREGFFRSYRDKLAYQDARDVINYRLQNVVKEMQFNWLREFRCLLVGKLVNGTAEQTIIDAVSKFFADNSSVFPTVSKKDKAITQCLVRSAMYLKLHEHKRAVQKLFPGVSKDVQIKIVKFIQELCESLKLHETRRHPLVLIVDEKLDIFPWEMMDVLENHPVTRMPCLHFTYALFKEHQDSIVDGLKIIKNSLNGAYIINPDSDLKQMEVRMNNFFKYNWPEWNSLVGVKPTSEQFAQLLTNSEIFSYHGHGNGSQFLPGDKIQKIKVEAVVLLFGCSSVTLTALGPQVEMIGQHYTYLIACSPCIVGMLWTVTDLDTDIVTTEFLSRWIKSNAPNHWKTVNKSQWQTGGDIMKSVSQKEGNRDKSTANEPELLRALCRARKEARHYTTAAACISRGLPVKIVYN